MEVAQALARAQVNLPVTTLNKITFNRVLILNYKSIKKKRTKLSNKSNQTIRSFKPRLKIFQIPVAVVIMIGWLEDHLLHPPAQAAVPKATTRDRLIG